MFLYIEKPRETSHNVERVETDTSARAYTYKKARLQGRRAFAGA